MAGNNRSERVGVSMRRAALIKARIDGMSFEDIADDPDFGYNGSVSAARKDFTRAKRAASQAEQEMADTWIELQVDRLEHYLASLAPRVDKGEPRAIEVAIAACKEIAKLRGINAAIKVDATVTETTPVDLELRDMINEAKARVAAEEAALRGEQ